MAHFFHVQPLCPQKVLEFARRPVLSAGFYAHYVEKSPVVSFYLDDLILQQ